MTKLIKILGILVITMLLLPYKLYIHVFLTSKVAPLAEDSSLGSTDVISSSMLPRDAELRSQRMRLPWLLAEDKWVESSRGP